MRKFVTRGLSALALVAVAAPAFAVDPTYTSQIAGALSAIDVTDVITDVTGFLGVIFALTLVGLGFAYVTGRLKIGVK